MLLSGPPAAPTPPLLLPESSGEGGGHDSSRAAAAATGSAGSAPKRRAETWVREETLCLIALRREMDAQFNTSKSNKHLWEAISSRMRDQGFDRSPTMCTDKWRNLLKEFKKARSHARSNGGGSGGAGGNGNAKMAYYKEIDDLLKRRGKGSGSGGCVGSGSISGSGAGKSPTSNSKIESYLFATDNGFEDANIPFGPVEANGRSILSIDDRLEDDRHPLPLTAADAVATNGVNPWNWRDTSTNGVTIKLCDTNRMQTPEDKTFYTEEDFRDFLARRGWTLLREYGGYRNVESLDDVRPGAIYQGMRSLGD
ncbi:unnamed protein product [Urochloa decumbens]|uniref:Myb-like domain-containing protein n=1 Tax=Urochloa decumbens TaxID=240449 RepID=A0ABC8XS51_9POAL